jgi:NADH/F420H2 dehydrogenase subunit C
MNVQTPIPTIYGGWNEKYGAQWAAFGEHLKSAHAEAVVEVQLPESHSVDIPTAYLKKSSVHGVLKTLKDDLGYSFLTDYTASDEGGEPRFQIILHLMNPQTKARVRLKFAVADGEAVPTLIPLWEGANWAEREIFDMFGIRFEGHPDLRRILMDVRFEGHPLRKDYPLRGYQVFLTPEPLDPELFK